MPTDKVPILESFSSHALMNEQGYEETYLKSVINPEEFWAEQAKKMEWMRP